MPKKKQEKNNKKKTSIKSKNFLEKLKNLVRKPDFLFVVGVVFLALLAGRYLLIPGYFNMHDDLQMMRQLAMEECFRDWQIPCRWTPHMGYGFGFPLFNYYPPLPYLVGEIFRLVGFSFVETVKLTFLISFVLSGLTMYLWAKTFWGRLGGLLSAAFYIWAPYHSLDIFVRGAMNEAWALIWFPLILWSSYELILKGRFRYTIILALSFTALLTSHNLMVLIFTPLAACWVLFWLLRFKSWSTIPQLAISGVWAFGLAAFFTLPVFLEQKFVHVETLVVGYYEYIAHFTTVGQLLFSRFWGYGASVWMDADDKMSFQIGHLHWMLPIVVMGLMVWRYYKTKKVDSVLFLTTFFFAAGWFATFMTHNKSTPIWLEFDHFLKFVQFPWRFLTLTILCFSFVVGAFPKLLNREKAKMAVFLLIGAVVGFNFGYFQPEEMGPITDQQKFTGVAWDMQQTAGIYDYLPVGANTAPKAPQKELALVISGKAVISDPVQKTNKASFKAVVESETSQIEIGIFQYPGWKVFVNGQEKENYIGNDSWGRMHIDLIRGEYQVVLKLENTPVRSAGNSISAVSWLLLFTAPLWRKKILTWRK
ncbi:MAG: hypothetical protein A3A58_01415 [Candidatus Blackburnbacteria bacterium RIFCSPLOWO2_01_FULL_41_27]|uniref:Membrane protein 6-pyruvoyl-tetrahydropterin synthase-related domain-containing protein n=2 Tax=Candidatus Blackburniibacteriota TaxID=1817898 RepID=A0A1G1VHF0_9BACT|nr:MAG: hypothetical protein A3A58_01415 [Candidatus Blackburnbacteria bacterium RIFCSPLOWO2_01_FULL_41_27]